jgi:Protein of unknown function (DUF4238)
MSPSQRLISVNAQKHHYVPKLIIRNFLFDKKREFVRVYDKKEDKEFRTSIRNIMAERRFHDFMFDEFIVSFEHVAGKIEEIILPAYRSVIRSKELTGSPEEKGALALLMAFQFIRTRAARDWWKQMDDILREKIESMGGSIEDMEGYEPPTENNLSKNHILQMREAVSEFAPIIAQKNFALMLAPKRRRFYLGDNPVVLHNENDFRPYGNIGLAVKGIQIFLPLTSEIVLCAFCPSIVHGLRDEMAAKVDERNKLIAAKVLSGEILVSQVKLIRESFFEKYQDFFRAISTYDECGIIMARDEHVDFINSLQSMYAKRFVLCAKGDLRLAREHNAEFPQFREGHVMRGN